MTKNALLRAQGLLPQHAISRLVGWLARMRLRPLKNLVIGAFVRLYAVNMSEAREPDPYAYGSFNDFFTRALRAGARTITQDPGVVVAPVDGTVSECGSIDEHTLVQAKGIDYTLAALLADHAPERFAGGSFVTIYLAPHDYHRVHAPSDASLTGHTYVPGRLFSVNTATAQAVPGLFARNERVVFDFDSAAGPLALVMVGALNVGSIESVHAGVIAPARPRHVRRVEYSLAQPMRRGDELARFNLGSTVILLFGPSRVRLAPSLRAGCGLRLGEPIAQLIDSR